MYVHFKFVRITNLSGSFSSPVPFPPRPHNGRVKGYLGYYIISNLTVELIVSPLNSAQLTGGGGAIFSKTVGKRNNSTEDFFLSTTFTKCESCGDSQFYRYRNGGVIR